MPGQQDPNSFFKLKSMKGARVSEISEATAAAPVPAHERVNFHIGNPLQDERQTSAFVRVALGLDIHNEDLSDKNLDRILETLERGVEEKSKLEFLVKTIQRSSPYSPRGGYSQQAPHRLIKIFSDWLKQQQEPLDYDTGEISGQREIILASGGIQETMRVILFVISSYLLNLPARILSFQCKLPDKIKSPPNLYFEDLADDEITAIAQIEQYLNHSPETPTFLLIGEIFNEATRRKLRMLSVEYPLFFIEANNSPNHFSLAREAKLEQKVIRLLSPGIFSNKLTNLSTVFVVGNTDYLRAIENMHFQLKGTPSASEIELLTFLLDHKLDSLKPQSAHKVPRNKPTYEGLGYAHNAESVIPEISERVEGYLTRVIDKQTQIAEDVLNRYQEKADSRHQLISKFWKTDLFDEFESIQSLDLLDLLIENIDNPTWHLKLEHSFLNNFTKHQPQYKPEACMVVSGSSRTALAIIGYHCGISEVVIPDLSWSYEQCFPKAHVVPLTPDLELDLEAFIEQLESLLLKDPEWKKRGAVVISNPHNATGQIFNQETLSALIKFCLQKNLYIIDDLAYQNMVPEDHLPQINTARHIANHLVKNGLADQAQADRVISVHTLSKTDSFAGARLSVVEIRDAQIRNSAAEIISNIQHNLAAILIAYLLYRNDRESIHSYWHLRNRLFQERITALKAAETDLPPDRNPYQLQVIPPKGSLYPLLQIKKLPAGLSLDWLASSLARQGIGMLPLSTFARTEEGFDTGRKTFRLTLGGSDNAKTLKMKMRRLLIDLNRLIAEEEGRYNRKSLKFQPTNSRNDRAASLQQAWDLISQQIITRAQKKDLIKSFSRGNHLDANQLHQQLIENFLPERLTIFKTRLVDRATISDELVSRGRASNNSWLMEHLEKELIKDSLTRRQEIFRLRSFDRTVHPTQMFSISAEIALDDLIQQVIHRLPVSSNQLDRAADQLVREYLGLNVSINSQEESEEIIADLSVLIAVEQYTQLFTETSFSPILSFWSDWDGSNRPSGQGHRLVGMVVMENVRRMTRLIHLVRQAAPGTPIPPEILSQLQHLPEKNKEFSRLLNTITLLTHQLEQRYKGILPYSLNDTTWKRIATRLGLRRDPAKILWQHNDHYEQKMLELRLQRRTMLEEYFALNKQLRKQLYSLISTIKENIASEELLREAAGYHDLLQRTAITPRIHQRQITARDQFAIDTTVFNLDEINTIAGKYGNPGMILALQVSMSTQADALISLDRKFRTQGQQMQREQAHVDLPSIWLIPLFEEIGAVKDIRNYLDKVWDYAAQSRHSTQTAQERFAEIISEVFIAGSDLSQQVSQASSAYLYHKVKYELQTWLAEHGVAESVRIKLGSGEPMQRQGGYYSQVSGQPAFIQTQDNKNRFKTHLPAAARKSTAYAATPLQGIFLGGDLRTYQSNLSEKLRYLPVEEFASTLHHIRTTQKIHRSDLIRAAETMTESRLGPQSRSQQELERLTIRTNDPVYSGFLDELTENFRQILYGRKEDVIGIHAISYFIGRSLPQLRDRPTSRKVSSQGRNQGQQILANIAEIIPFSDQGSMLRAIAHNQAQTVVLGINQLTTGIFRGMERFSQKSFAEAQQRRMITERILPNLPIYEILNTLRMYQDWQGEFLGRIETAFPAGNSAFVALREDNDAMNSLLPLFQKELIRRHGLDINDFFEEDEFTPNLLPTLRPELAVLLQKNIFNADIDTMLTGTDGKIPQEWQDETVRVLKISTEIQRWRREIWEIIGDSIYQRVQSFAEIANALFTLSTNLPAGGSPIIPRSTKLTPSLTNFFRTARADDEMRHFLIGTIEYLNTFVEGNIEVPISIIRAINDVERLAQIEENALPAEKQDQIRFCLLQIARLAGDNG